MSRTSRLWKGLGPLMLGGLLLSGGIAAHADAPTLPKQLVELGRQAAAQGNAEQAKSFYRNALKLDPSNKEANEGMARLGIVRRVSFNYQDPPTDMAAPAPGTAPASPSPADMAPSISDGAAIPITPGNPAGVPELSPLDRQAQLNTVAREAFVTDVRQRLQAARNMSNAGNPDAALAGLRNVLTIVQSGTALPEDTRRRLENEVRNTIGATERLEERTNLERAEQYRISASQSARSAAVDRLVADQEVVNNMMTEFDSLMIEGNRRNLESAGLGDIDTIRQPFVDARFMASAARAKAPGNPTPYAGVTVADSTGFLVMSHSYDLLKEYRAMLTWADVERTGVPFPDTRAIEYPERAAWQALSERRIKRYGDAEYLFDRDEKTKAILSKLNERISMNFPNDTPLSDVQKYIEQSTQDEAAGLPTGIPIYVDPQGLQDADKTMASTVAINLEGIPLRTTLRLLLRQLNLTYTVKDGLLTITSSSSEDQPTEIRVYQVADLAIIPLSLLGGGGGGGGMGGGGMGGGGMGGMGGGGMGGGGMGGMGGGGMGGMGGMMSLPPQDPSLFPGTGAGFDEKKSN